MLGRHRLFTPPLGGVLFDAALHLEVFLLIDAEHAFVVVGPAFPPQDDPQPSIPKPAALGGLLPQGVTQWFIVGWPGMVVVAAPG